jgi:hypothetical protein
MKERPPHLVLVPPPAPPADPGRLQPPAVLPEVPALEVPPPRPAEDLVDVDAGKPVEGKPADLEAELGDARDRMEATRRALDEEAKAKEEAARRAREARLPFLPPWVPEQVAHAAKVLASIQKANVATARRANVTPPPPSPEERLHARGLPEGYLGVTWSDLATLRRRGRLSLGEVQAAADGRRLRGDEAVEELMVRMQAPIVVLVGETRAGKTLAAAAAFDAEVRGGGRGRLWVQARMLGKRDTPAEREAVAELLARMERARSLYLDDAGYECGRHDPDVAWSHNAALPARDFLARWFERGDDRRLVVTTNFDGAELARRYGPEAAARLFEHAEVIQMFRRTSAEDDPVLDALTRGDDDDR